MSWDPLTNARERAAAREHADVVPPLDPPWPFRLVAFDPFAFRVDRDPPAPTSPASSPP